jgi:hypothetical protein
MLPIGSELPDRATILEQLAESERHISEVDRQASAMECAIAHARALGAQPVKASAALELLRQTIEIYEAHRQRILEALYKLN